MSIETKSEYLDVTCDNIVEELFSRDYEYDVEAETYFIPIDEKPMLIDDYVCHNMSKNELIKLVSYYGVFNAIKLHNNTYDDLDLSEMTLTSTYRKLAYDIIDEYINENELITDIDST